MGHLPHVLFALTCAALAGALWGAIAGSEGDGGRPEVITTIILNWIAYWGGSYLFGRDGPLQNHFNKAVPISDDIVPNAKLPTLWGNPHLQALHVGIFIAVGALIAFYLILNRTTLGYEVRAVGFNPEAARYGGISVARNFILALAISGSSPASPAASTSSAGVPARGARRAGGEHLDSRHRRRTARAQQPRSGRFGCDPIGGC